MDLSVKEYAKTNKLSIYQVIKKLQKGELQGYQKEIDGERVQFIRVDKSVSEPPAPANTPKNPTPTSSTITKEDFDELKKEIKSLKDELKIMRMLLEKLSK